MRILVTGGAGFIGSHAVDHFVSMGDDVVVVDKLTYAGRMENLQASHGKFAFHLMDICDIHALNQVFLANKFDAVVNFAAETHVDNSINGSERFIESNVQGATSLMQLCRHYDALFCQLSTDEVYGDATGRAAPFKTTAPLAPRNPYSATKAAADLMLLACHNTYGQPYLIFRPSNNFGPRQHDEKFLPKLVGSMVSGADFPLYGDGSQAREWTYAPDTARFIWRAIADGRRNEVLNISSGCEMRNVDVIKHVKRALWARGVAPKGVVKHVADRPGHDRRYWIESSFDSREFSAFDVCLEQTVDHYLAKHR